MKEHGDILQDLPQRVHTGFTDKHDTLLARNAEVMVLLTALSSSLALLSKDTQVLKETVTKVDSALVESHTSSTERSTLSNQEISSVAQVRTDHNQRGSFLIFCVDRHCTRERDSCHSRASVLRPDPQRFLRSNFY